MASADGVLIRIVEFDGWQRVVIELGEDTTNEALRSAIPLALQHRERLFALQGPWIQGGETPSLADLDRRNAAGESYAQLAERINQRAAALVREAVEYRSAFEAAEPTIHSPVEWVTWWKTADLNPSALDHARHLLRAVKLDERSIERHLQEGMQRAIEGEPPFDPESPLDRDKMISVLRTWRNGKKQKWLTNRAENCGDSLS